MTADEAAEHGGSSRDPSQSTLLCWKTRPTLRLLSTPWEYFVTIDQSALWQKHIAWAKPRGSDLKAYVSSQYSSRMVLLSLLLATETSVFFNSSPVIVDMRSRLNVWDNSETATAGILPFWIGFFLLLNICVTISGILATFSTWSVVSAISDSNAHCLLRSSLGQYVATLSPRLVVVSLYLFLLWFLLFVVELLFGGGSFSFPGLHVLLTRHLHLVVLWGCFLVGITALFFSIVVPLSAFGRLVLHTGAMAEQPVLSESLQVELLPRGLHAGLVIRAHHSQKRRTAVTLQYTQRKRLRQGQRNRSEEDEIQQQQQQQQPRSPQGYNDDNIRQISSLPLTSRVPTADIVAENGGIGIGNSYEEGVGHGTDDGMTSSVIFTRPMSAAVAPSSGMSVSTASSGCNIGDTDMIIGNGDRPNNRDKHRNEDYRMGPRRSAVSNKSSNHFFHFDQKSEDYTSDHYDEKNRWTGNPYRNEGSKDCVESKNRRLDSSRRHSHRRMATIETGMPLCLPPATILNLSMTAREFHDVIDSAMDTSSLCSTRSQLSKHRATRGATTGSERNDLVGSHGDEDENCPINHHSNPTASIALGSTEERRRRTDSNQNGECFHDGPTTSKKEAEVVAHASRERYSGTRSSHHRGGIPLSPCPVTLAAAAAQADGGVQTIPPPKSQRSSSSSSSRNTNHQDLVTRHHRRVSSSRFLLEEWAQENRVRDLYGAGPPADLPHEIAWLLENENETKTDTRCRQPEPETQAQAQAQAQEANGNGILCHQSLANSSHGSTTESVNPPQKQQWWLSPFSSPLGARNQAPSRNTDRSLHQNRRGRSRSDETTMVGTAFIGGNQVTLKEPLLPDLTSFRDEELGIETSELLGECLLPSVGDRRQNTRIASNRIREK